MATWYTVDKTGHVPGIAAELPPGRVLLDENNVMIDHDWDEVVEVQEVVHERDEQPPIEAQEQVND